jgi:hypothetical protein
MTNGNSAADRFEYARSLLPDEMYWGEPITVEAVLHIAEAALSVCADGGELRDFQRELANYFEDVGDPHGAIMIRNFADLFRADGGKGEAVATIHVKKSGDSFVHAFQTLKYGILPEGVHNLFTAPQASEGEVLGHALYEALCDQYDESEAAPQAECAPLPKQEPLGEPFQTVLDENRWNLYAECTPREAQPDPCKPGGCSVKRRERR